MCLTFKAQKVRSDSQALINTFSKHMADFYKQFSEQELDSIFTKCYYRLQLYCNDFKMMLERNEKGKNDWVATETYHVSIASKNECSLFFQTQQFKYLEANGDSVSVFVNENSWTDYFKDGTYSRLSLKRINDADFELTFIESNNSSRRNISNAGDKYLYRILEKSSRHYLMLVSIPNNPRRFQFKLYY